MAYRGAWLAAVIVGLGVGSPPAQAETLAVFTKSAGNPIARAVRAGAEAVAKAHGITVFHYIPTSPDNVPQQTALVDEALSAKRDAIVFTPVDVKAMVPVVQKINAEIGKVLSTPEAKKLMASAGVDVSLANSEDFARLLGSELERWGKVVKETGAKVN